MICPNCGTRLPLGIVKCHFCGTKVTLASMTNFVDKFVALFTLMAFFISTVILFYTLWGDVGDMGTRAIVSAIIGLVMMILYWKASPCMVRVFIDSKIK